MKILNKVMLTCMIVVLMTACTEQILEHKYNSTTTNEDEYQANTEATNIESDEYDGREEVYYAVGMHINVPYWQEHKRGLEAAADELGVQVVFTGEEGNDGINQIRIFDQIIEKNPSGILVAPIDAEGMAFSINRAIDAGIPVICIDTDAPKSNRLTYFGTDNYEAGWTAANILAKAIEEEGEVGILSIPGVQSIDRRIDGFRDCMAKNYPNIEVIFNKSDEGNMSQAISVTSQMLLVNPSLKGIFGGDSISGVGAAMALKDAGKTGEVKIVSMDRDTRTLELVEEGVIEATMVQRTFTMSYYATKFLYDYNHNHVKIANDMADINPLPQQVDTGIIVVDKSNVENFK